MDTATIPYRVHQCSKCPGDTEYYCESCLCDLCPRCEGNHVKNLKTIDHNVVIYREKFNFIPKQEICVRHPSNVHRKYCEPCQVLVREQHRGTIHTIRSEALFYRPVLLQRIKADVKTCHAKFSRFQSEMLTKVQPLKDLIDKLLYDLLTNVFCDFDFKHICLKQKIETSIHIVSLQRYIHMYEQSTFSALQFLSSIKTPLPPIHLTLHTSQLSMTESLNKQGEFKLLIGIQFKEREKEKLLKRLHEPKFYGQFRLSGVFNCSHISCVTSDRVSISDNENNLILINKTGGTQHRLKDLCRDIYGGSHTVNSESELIYIDRKYNINRLSKDMKTSSIIIKRTDTSWKPRCVYWSPSNGDLLVGMYNYDAKTGKVTRYKTKTMTKHDDNGLALYSKPKYITENDNGDVVVSDHGAVVVTERGGRHRFSYTGHPSESRLRPRGICTDALSHILVCDSKTKKVHMLNEDSQFLLYLIEHLQLLKPYSLGYEFNTHRLWVGSKNKNKSYVYEFIERCNTSSVQSPTTDDVMDFQSGIKTKEAKNLQTENEHLLKISFPPQVLNTFLVPGVQRCFHISFKTSDQIWVSDEERNFVLTNTTGNNLHYIKGLPADESDLIFNDSRKVYGVHTVNSDGAMIYIDVDNNIKKISNKLETTTAIKTKHAHYTNLCVYWSPSTGDLLVGLIKMKNAYDSDQTGMVHRYSQSGQLLKKVKYNNTGVKLYSEPHYITENNNGDVVVSDRGAVVVTERGGGHRFSYKKLPSGLRIDPRGICTDSLSQILVCDVKSVRVLVIDKDGLFLRFLSLESLDICRPHSLSYDKNNDCLWVGSKYNNKVCVCRYITPQKALTDSQNCPDGFALTTLLPI